MNDCDGTYVSPAGGEERAVDATDMTLTQPDETTGLVLGWQEEHPHAVYVFDGNALRGTFVPRGTPPCKEDAQALLWYLTWTTNKRYLSDLVPAPDCQHPAKRLYSWHAYDGSLCVCCCDCGEVLRGGGA